MIRSFAVVRWLHEASLMMLFGGALLRLLPGRPPARSGIAAAACACAAAPAWR